MTIHISSSTLPAILAILAGIGVLVAPSQQRYILGAFLIAFGVLELFF